MDFLKSMNSVLDYIEDNLDGEITDDKIAQLTASSKGMFQRIFTVITDMTLSEYIRKRKLTQAGFDVQNTEDKIIDIAVKYGYNSADSFSLAFKNFHGVTPSDARKSKTELKSFERLIFTLSISVKGGSSMQYLDIIDTWHGIDFYLERTNITVKQTDEGITTDMGEHLSEMEAVVFSVLDEQMKNKKGSLTNAELGAYVGIQLGKFDEELWESGINDMYEEVKKYAEEELPYHHGRNLWETTLTECSCVLLEYGEDECKKLIRNNRATVLVSEYLTGIDNDNHIAFNKNLRNSVIGLIEKHLFRIRKS